MIPGYTKAGYFRIDAVPHLGTSVLDHQRCMGGSFPCQLASRAASRAAELMYRCRSLREMQCKCATPVQSAAFQPRGWSGAAESGLQKTP